MPVSAAERRFILDNLTRLVEADIRTMWAAAEVQTEMEFAAYVAQAFPRIVDPYHQMAAQSSATIFEEDFPQITEAPIVAPPLPEERLVQSAAWALAAEGTAAIDRMVGTAQRAVYDGDRETTVSNASRNGMRWVRVARPDACQFCKMLSARTVNGFLYSGDGVQSKINPKTKMPFADNRLTTVVSGRRRKDSKRSTGKEYHDNCHCVAKAIPARRDPLDYLAETEPQAAALAEQFNDEYEKAVAAAGGRYAPKTILSEWRKADKAR